MTCLVRVTAKEPGKKSIGIGFYLEEKSKWKWVRRRGERGPFHVSESGVGREFAAEVPTFVGPILIVARCTNNRVVYIDCSRTMWSSVQGLSFQ